MSLSPVSTTFLGSENLTDPSLVQTPYAFIGIPYGPPYAEWELTASADAADSVRNLTASRGFTRFLTHWNFDLGEPQFENGRPNITDLGNVTGDVHNIARMFDDATTALLPLIRRNIVPIVVGGLDSVPPMVVAPFQGLEEINVLQIDAHIDFRDEIYGRRDGYSSPMRRIREYSCVRDLVQVGARSIGSARREEVEAALEAGNRIVTAWDVHEQGAQHIATGLDLSRRWVICVDCDGMDPTIAPAVGVPEPGGLNFLQTATFFRHLARRNRIAGVIFTEYQPAKDMNGTTALTIIRLLLNVLGIQREPEKPKAATAQ